MGLRADDVAKVYSAPLNLQETPLTLAVNLSSRLGNEVSSGLGVVWEIHGRFG